MTETAASLIQSVREKLAAQTFVPHRIWRGGHRQTIAAHLSLARRRTLRKALADSAAQIETRLFQTEADTQVLAHCQWQSDDRSVRAKHPTLILVHGLEGSSVGIYMLGTGSKAFARGFNVVRLNMRNCGDTEHLTPTLYNSGITADVRGVVTELLERDKLASIFIAGFSMGGNVVLKFVGELGENAPPGLKACCAVSPSLDLAACASAIERRSNLIYQTRFVKSLRARMQRKNKLFPGVYDLSNLKNVRTVRQFDETFTAPYGGYANANDYYDKASAIRNIANINIPTLIITAQDDTFIPFASFQNEAINNNPNIILLAPKHGGHVAFLADKAEPAVASGDRFWAEYRIVEFCELINNAHA